MSKINKEIEFEEGEIDESQDEEEPDKDVLKIGEDIVFDELDELDDLDNLDQVDNPGELDETNKVIEKSIPASPKSPPSKTVYAIKDPNETEEEFLERERTNKDEIFKVPEYESPPKLEVPKEKIFTAKEFQEKKRRKDKGDESVYEKVLITRNVSINILNIGKNIETTLKTILMEDYEGKCNIEGYIKNNSVQIINYSNGLLNGVNVIFTVMFTCLVCFPVEGMNITCIAKNITKAGISAESFSEEPTPFIVFVSRDHHHNNNNFNKIKIGDKFDVRVIGQRFELNDPTISIIAELKKIKTGPRFDF